MSWLDQVLALPIVGMNTKPNLLAASRFLEVFAPRLDRWTEEEGASLDVTVGPVELDVSFPSGFEVRLTDSSIVVSFEPKARRQPRAGKLPEIQVPEVARYSTLLEKARRLARDILDTFANSPTGPLDIRRFGIVAKARLESRALPPGVADFVDALKKALPGRLVKSNTTLVFRVRESEQGHDQCHHSIHFDEPDAEETRLVLDWQRIYRSALQASANQELDAVSSSALEYFEQFGSGSLGHGSS
jgi:hypothetical protein